MGGVRDGSEQPHAGTGDYRSLFDGARGNDTARVSHGLLPEIEGMIDRFGPDAPAEEYLRYE